MASDLLRFNKGTDQLFLKGAKGEQQIVAPPTTENKTVFVLVDASGSVAFRKFEDATKGALDFGLVGISKNYLASVVVFSAKRRSRHHNRTKDIPRKLKCTSGGTLLASALVKSD